MTSLEEEFGNLNVGFQYKIENFMIIYTIFLIIEGKPKKDSLNVYYPSICNIFQNLIGQKALLK